MNKNLDRMLANYEEVLRHDLPPFYIAPEITPDMKLADGKNYDEFKEGIAKMGGVRVDEIKELDGSSQETYTFPGYLKKGLTDERWIKTAFYALYIKNQIDMRKKGNSIKIQIKI